MIFLLKVPSSVRSTHIALNVFAVIVTTYMRKISRDSLRENTFLSPWRPIGRASAHCWSLFLLKHTVKK
jgi:hypothetical protein